MRHHLYVRRALRHLHEQGIPRECLILLYPFLEKLNVAELTESRKSLLNRKVYETWYDPFREEKQNG